MIGSRSYPEFEQTKQDKFSRIPSKKGIISAVYTQTWSADVQLIGGNQGIIKNIPLASTVSPAIMAGDKCVLDIFDEQNPQDSVVAYTYGRRIKPKVTSGSTSVSTGGTTIAHGLGAIPDVVIVFLGASAAYSQSVNISVTEDLAPFATSSGNNSIPITDNAYQYQAATNTSIFLKAIKGTVTVQWYAFTF